MKPHRQYGLAEEQIRAYRQGEPARAKDWQQQYRQTLSRLQPSREDASKSVDINPCHRETELRDYHGRQPDNPAYPQSSMICYSDTERLSCNTSLTSAVDSINSDAPGSRHLLDWLDEERRKSCGRLSRVPPLSTVPEPSLRDPDSMTCRLPRDCQTPTKEAHDTHVGQQSRFSISPDRAAPERSSSFRVRRSSYVRPRKLSKPKPQAKKSLQSLRKLMCV